jgi:hypothetical protein
MLRRTPLFLLPGTGDYLVQPVSVGDVARIAVQTRAGVVDAAGPDLMSFATLVSMICAAVRGRARIVSGPRSVGLRSVSDADGRESRVRPARTTGGDRRTDRPHSRQLPSSYQVTLDGLGSATATQRWQVSPRATCGIESAVADPSLRRTADATTPSTMTVSARLSSAVASSASELGRAVPSL